MNPVMNYLQSYQGTTTQLQDSYQDGEIFYGDQINSSLHDGQQVSIRDGGPEIQ